MNIRKEDQKSEKISIFYSIIVVSCGDPTGNITLQNQIYDSGSKPTTFNYLTLSLLRCRVGMKWSDNTITKAMVCSAAGTWTGITAFCACIISFACVSFAKI